MTAPLVIFGAGGCARDALQVVLDINQEQPTWTILGFLVDPTYSAPNMVHGLPVLGSIAWLSSHPDVSIIVAVGSAAARYRIVQAIRAAGHSLFARLVHPRAWMGRRIEIGEGTIICAGALITTDIEIGQHVHVNMGATIGHDAVLHDFVTLNPNVSVSGNVTLHKGVEVGTGSVLIPKVHVGDWTIIGAGSVVTKPLPGNTTAVGAPARTISTRNNGWHERAVR